MTALPWGPASRVGSVVWMTMLVTITPMPQKAGSGALLRPPPILWRGGA